MDGNCSLLYRVVLSCSAFISGKQLISSLCADLPMEAPTEVRLLAGLKEFSWG